MGPEEYLLKAWFRVFWSPYERISGPLTSRLCPWEKSIRIHVRTSSEGEKSFYSLTSSALSFSPRAFLKGRFAFDGRTLRSASAKDTGVMWVNRLCFRRYDVDQKSLLNIGFLRSLHSFGIWGRILGRHRSSCRKCQCCLIHLHEY